MHKFHLVIYSPILKVVSLTSIKFYINDINLVMV